MQFGLKTVLAASAGMTGIGAASAADLPSRAKGPAVEYVRICDAQGAGFFFIPGADTCLKIGGYARADYQFRTVHNVSASRVGGTIFPVAGPKVNSQQSQDSSGFRARGQIDFDARSETDYGRLRGYVRYRITQGDGAIVGTNVGGVAGAPDAQLDQGYVQWAGITAGRLKSFFDGLGSGPDYPLDSSRAYDSRTQVLAYTAKFGAGFSATLSLEDPVARRGATSNGVFGVNAFGPGTPHPIPAGPPFVFVPALTAPTVTYGGLKYPDVVASLRVEQDWGMAMLNGAVHQVNTIASTTVGSASANKTGWAALGLIKINLPMLAKGDEVFIQAVYANGAKSYLGGSSTSNNIFIGSTAPFGFIRNDVDAVRVNNAVGPGYSLETSRGYLVQAGITHYWLPNVFQRFWASYASLDYGSGVKNIDWRAGGLGRGRDLIVDTNVTWQPVKDLDIVADFSYTKMWQTLAHFPGLAPSVLPAFLNKDANSFASRLRLQRNF